LKNKANFVIATTRSDSTDLYSLASKNKNLKVINLETTNQASVDGAVAAATPFLPNGLDYLVNNAGKNPQPMIEFKELDLDLFSEEMIFNTVAPLRVSRAFLALVKKSEAKKIIFISSVLASSQITFMMVDQFNAYTVANAALNALAHKWGASLKREGVSTAAIHPGKRISLSLQISRTLPTGWTQTELGDPLKEWMSKYAPPRTHLTTDEAGNVVIKISLSKRQVNSGTSMALTSLGKFRL
ncbi:hypothetical protein CPB84DRAFT_1685889, partial [Gymnopilus junonius]